MPKIEIKERDLTTAGRAEISSNVVYVPGFVKHVNSKYSNIKFPYLFNTLEEFKLVFSNEDGSFELLGYAAESSKENGGDSSTTQDSAGTTTNGMEKSQLYALSLLQLGLPVLFDLVDGKETTEKTASGYLSSMTEYLTSTYLNKLKDKNTYNIKFLTSGGYYLSSLGSDLMSVAESRGDCVALVDHTESTDKAISISDVETTYGTLGDALKYGAMFTPWCTFQFPKWDSKKNTPLTSMPGSLAYLLAFANSVANNNSNWLAAAGMNRGIVPYLESPLVNLAQSDIDSYLKPTGGISINPITNITPQGVIIWGNRTLYNSTSGLVASNFLNIRQLCNDIKKTLYVACKYLTFELNSDILWVKFKSLITPLLDQMLTGDGISGYQITKKKSTRATLTAIIRIYPIEAVEDFDITLELADDSTATITGNT